ncbi:MAG: prolipoprotein diacylglyceryl transferase [Candidatus Omnitrophica bacterium]|nr:prolipoprotein diacylglyceryl transferase [Candidatus Omnitrophota bacterium]MDD5352777.1 prolipoprotein diacylglyceryl transferase [Candidatus Omnitrophota bacterium]MDD5550376.1 prolipoprotein diacylglyceryl transferase [Candidatus Omnitrophota bacterium]
MHPILFEFGPITIYSYGFILFIAVIVSLSLFVKEAARLGYNKDTMFDLGVTILFSGIIGARILYILLNLDFYLKHPKEIFMLHHGGLAILGGIFLGLVAAFIFAKRRKIPLLKILDLVVPYVALGQSIGRIGCFFNGCCYGIASDKFGIYFPVHNAILIPSQLISSFLLLILYIILRFKQTKSHKTGTILFSYLLYYSTGRFFIEFIRADSPKLFLGLTIFQYFCLALFITGLLLYIFTWKRKTSK